MKTLLTIIATLCITVTTFAQRVTEKETSIKISADERKQIQEVKDVIVELSENLRTSLEEKEKLNEKDIVTLKTLLEAIDDKYKNQKKHKEIIIKTDNPSEHTSISYAFSIGTDGEIETLEDIKEIDLSELKEKLSELSISINDSDAMKVLAEKLKEKEIIIKTDNPSEHTTSTSYAFSVKTDGEIETLEDIKEIDLNELKEKLSELSISLNESDDIKLLIEKLNQKAVTIHQEIEEKKEKTKH